MKQVCVHGHWYKHTPRTNPEVQYAFKILMTHWILQFALRIAVRSVLHRCASLDIHCWKLYFNCMQIFLSAVLISRILKRIQIDIGFLRNLRLAATRAAQSLIKSTFTWGVFWCGNDPSAGSPTETLLRLHLPLNGEVKESSHKLACNEAHKFTVPILHRVIQSVGATGGVYKGQGRNQCKLMTCVY